MMSLLSILRAVRQWPDRRRRRIAQRLVSLSQRRFGHCRTALNGLVCVPSPKNRFHSTDYRLGRQLRHCHAFLSRLEMIIRDIETSPDNRAFVMPRSPMKRIGRTKENDFGDGERGRQMRTSTVYPNE